MLQPFRCNLCTFFVILLSNLVSIYGLNNLTSEVKKQNVFFKQQTLSEYQIVKSPITTDVDIPCKLSNVDKILNMSWWYCGLVRKQIGYVDNKGDAVTTWDRDGAFKVLNTSENGTLRLFNVGRHLVERYECNVIYENSVNETLTVFFRLDFSFWFDFKWNSLFYGSCLSSFVFFISSFFLNVIWIICRKIVLWWINRAERISRVRSMVEAIEKYRHRQMENLHESYHRRVTMIRDNYHQQVDQLRASYSNQVGRFRGYRQAQMENVTQHLDNIRENYYQQLSKIRDYGSRHTEQLWENYERQLNRMRLFTLQQRLKLMRQYKVKQRYINKLLEAIADTNNPDVIQKQEAEIRAALNLSDDLAFPHSTISRSSSYYSLPEFVIEDDESASSYFSTITKNTSGASFRQKNMPSHHYQTFVVHLKPRSEGYRFRNTLDLDNGISSNELFKKDECKSMVNRSEFEQINFESDSSKEAVASTSSFNTIKKDSIKNTADSSVCLKKKDHKFNEITNCIDDLNDSNTINLKRVNFS